MRHAGGIVIAFVLAFVAILPSPKAAAQTLAPNGPSLVSCSPTPCVLPPVQASEGGALVNTSPIAANPLNTKQLLVGSNDWNCPDPSASGFHLSSDAGSIWNLVCMPVVQTKNVVFWPGGDPLVAYDRNGIAYIASGYSDSEGAGIGFVGLQSSQDGTHWGRPVAALVAPESFPYETWLTVDTNVGSPFLNSLYVSGVLIGPPGVQSENRVTVSHSGDGGKTWKNVAVARVQNYPEGDAYTNMTSAKDGTIYLTWMFCNTGPYFCNDHKGHMVFSKSKDGGDTWSTPKQIAEVTLLSTALPNTNVGVSNIPVIGVDNSNGPYAGSLYVVMYSWTGSYMRVGVIRSIDGGNTWSRPVPVAPPSANHDQFFPWLSVNDTGLVGVSWLDRRNDPANIDYQAFAAFSTDAGQTFQTNVQLSTAFSNPNVNGYPFNEWMGDYTGNTWIGSNFLASWMDSSNGVDMQEVVGGIRVK